MKRIFKIVLIALIASVGVACTAAMDFDINLNAPGEAGPEGECIITFGELDFDHGLFVADSGLKLYIEQLDPSIAWSDLEVIDNQRALINYSLVAMIDVESYSVRLNRIYDIVVKDAIFYDSGDNGGVEWSPLHPAMPYQASFSGGYINVNVHYPAIAGPEVTMPDIRLFCNLEASTDDTLMLQLYHNAAMGFDSENASIYSIWYSFRVGGDWLEEAEDADIFAFQWSWWANENDHSKGCKTDNMSVMFVDGYDEENRASMSPIGL